MLTWPDALDARRAGAIAVLSAQQVEMVRRSYRKDALVAPVGPPAHFFAPPDRAAARARLGIPERGLPGVGVRHPCQAQAVRGPDRRDVAAGRRSPRPRVDRGLRSRRPRLRGPAGGPDRRPRSVGPRDAAAASLSDAELKDTYAAADVFVILSQRYAWGLAPLEALASGTPVILTPGAGVYDILAGRAGVQVVSDAGSPATAEAIRRWRSGEGRTGSSRHAPGCARSMRSTPTWHGWSRSMRT